MVPLGLTPAVFSTTAHAGDGDKKDEPTHDEGALVKIEVRNENGKIDKHTAKVRQLGMDWKVQFEGGDHQHEFVFNIEKGKKVKAKLSYSRDGQKIIAPFSDTYGHKKREVLRTDKGIALALTFTWKKFPRDENSRDDDSALKPDGGDDPLGDNPLR